MKVRFFQCLPLLVAFWGLLGSASAASLFSAADLPQVQDSGFVQAGFICNERGEFRSTDSVSNRPTHVDREVLFALTSPAKYAAHHMVAPEPMVERLRKAYHLRGVTAVFKAQEGSRTASGFHTTRPVDRSSLDLVFRARIPSDTSLFKVIKRMQHDPAIQWAEPNYLRYSQSTLPNDSVPAHLYQIGAPQAWDATIGSRAVVIAIIDTGVDYTHPDLSDNIWLNSGEVDGDAIDNDHNGYVDDIRGWDFVSVATGEVIEGEDPGPPDNDPMDFHGHGTHIAGIAGAVGDNGFGIAGVNWEVSLMVLRAAYKTGDGDGVLQIADIANALVYAADNGAHIINLSFGSRDPSQAEKVAVDYCIAKGVLLVAAAGNEYTDAPSYPAAYEKVIAVGNVMASGKRQSSSAFGLWVDLSAPGFNINSTVIGGGYGYKSGTSMAAPVVAGVAGLIKSEHREWTADQIRLQLQTTATSLNAQNPDHANLMGAGLISASAALSTVSPPAKVVVVNLRQDELPGSQDGFCDPGETIPLVPTIRNFGLLQNGVSVSLSSADPYVRVLDGSAILGEVNEDGQKTASGDPFTVYIDPATPQAHFASLDLTVTTMEPWTQHQATFILHCNPVMGRPYHLDFPFQLSTGGEGFENVGRTNVLPLTKPDGGMVVLMQNFGFNGNTYIAAQSVDSSGTWSPSEQISDAPAIVGGRSNYAGVVDPSAVTHVVFNGNLAPFNSQLFYTRQDPETLLWTTPEQITTNADVFGDYVRTIAVDPSGGIHVIWGDHRSGSLEFYHTYNDGAGWSEETLIGIPSGGIQRTSPFRLIFDADANAYLFWVQYDLATATVYEVYMMKSVQGVWESPSPIVESDYFALTMDAQGGIHMAYHDTVVEQLSYIHYDGMRWSMPESLVAGDAERRFWLALSSADVPHFIHMWREQWSADTNLGEMIHNGSTWSDPVLRIATVNMWSGFHDQALTLTAAGHRVLGFATFSDIAAHPQMIRPYLLSSDRSPVQYPTRPIVVDGGDYTDRSGLLHAFWSASHETGIADYEYAIGTAPGIADLKGWTLTEETQVTADLTAAPLTRGQQYFISVRARNKNGYWSAVGVSDGIVYGAPDPVQALDSDDFQAGFGNWTNGEGDDIDWSRNSSKTPSRKTGPAVDHTLGNTAGFYLYIESSRFKTRPPGNPHKTAILESPCIDLGDARSATWTFWYHMRGNAMGRLYAEVAPGCGPMWTAHFSASGDHGNDWIQGQVDLSDFTWTRIRLRFRGLTGQGYTSDMAIDDISLETAP